jgi:hypothetical protein
VVGAAGGEGVAMLASELQKDSWIQSSIGVSGLYNCFYCEERHFKSTVFVYSEKNVIALFPRFS